MPATRFLFWNLNRKPLAGLVADLAEEHQIDFVILSECENERAAVLWELNRTASRFHLTDGACPYITIFSAAPRQCLRLVFESDRISIRAIEFDGCGHVLLVAVHLPSKLRWTAESQAIECGGLAKQIESEESQAGHRRTILVGDFNMNPFEAGIVGGLHSVTSRQIAARGSRTVQGREYPFFYNPMWCHFGDAASHTAGSYFYDAGEHVNHYWNMFDQVLLRPELASRFKPDQLRILHAAGELSLVRPNGQPDQQVGSDHLPLLFDVEI